MMRFEESICGSPPEIAGGVPYVSRVNGATVSTWKNEVAEYGLHRSKASKVRARQYHDPSASGGDRHSLAPDMTIELSASIVAKSERALISTWNPMVGSPSGSVGVHRNRRPDRFNQTPPTGARGVGADALFAS